MRAGLVAWLWLAVLARDALAVARHDPPRTSPIRKDGKTVGVQVTLKVHPETYENVRIGLGRMKAIVPASVSDQGEYKRKLAAGVRPGYLRVELGEKTGLANKTYEFTFKVLYDQHGLKGGEKVDVVSAFYNRSSYFHVYGMFDGPVTRGDATSVIVLPK
jgi:hypothetical protein